MQTFQQTCANFINKAQYINGYTHQQTAQALQLPLGTVKSRIKAALKILKSKVI
ncbi:sigma factor-like helix-turn-helix DNA-binding protein [Rhodocytophaga aerolata]|uniref:Sigma factor-like helix-turn-helix DNA-binding protein n=1 Tax=Rhodocytophaga aerolata TaxID=455078 RepID=A0ABT8RKD6_9BACT|nr:sigma factor-like helix-turn-helix DNA-binding protein [Rhodocytophaga aerolata]MDO1451332.1 sigma factor-like helix-turn-helix DNA-binding protein [Rhodocytophaga aerolata]